MLPALIQRAREVMKHARDTADVIWYVGGATLGWFGDHDWTFEVIVSSVVSPWVGYLGI
jgi:hypothetical protein